MKPNAYRLGTDDPVMLLELSVTSWCNYRCAYCVTEVHSHRAESRHAFDNHPVERWVDAFTSLSHDFSLVCRGGEPFLDHENFASFLGGVGSLERLRYMRVDTNGSWDPSRYAGVPAPVREKIALNVSFHPTQITLERFAPRVEKILAAGFRIGMINFVMEQGQASGYESLRERFRGLGVFVNANPDAFDPRWMSEDALVRAGARRALGHLLPPADLMMKTGRPTRGKGCFFPSISYFIDARGVAERACGVRRAGEQGIDFLRSPEALQPLREASVCPQAACACLDRYAFLEELEGRAESLDLLGEYVRDCAVHQKAMGTLGKRAWRAVVTSMLGTPRRLPLVEDAGPRRSTGEA